MIITQDDLIRQIAEKEDINVATVRDIFKSAEGIVFDHLSSTPPSENVIVKLLKGFSLERRYVHKKKYTKGMFKNIECPAHINIKAVSSKYYNNRVNEELFK